MYFKILPITANTWPGCLWDHTCRPPLCSSWRPCRPSYQTTSLQPGILRRRSYSVEQPAVTHSNYFCDNFQESTQDSFIYPVILHNIISSVRCCIRRPCSDWTCYGAPMHSAVVTQNSVCLSDCLSVCDALQVGLPVRYRAHIGWIWNSTKTISRLNSLRLMRWLTPNGSVRALPTEAAKTVVNSFVVSRIDYCNSLLDGAPKYQLDRLQAVMNTAARLTCIYGVGKFDRIQHLISDRLHWLPVHKRVQFKLCLYWLIKLYTA